MRPAPNPVITMGSVYVFQPTVADVRAGVETVTPDLQFFDDRGIAWDERLGYRPRCGSDSSAHGYDHGWHDSDDELI